SWPREVGAAFVGRQFHLQTAGPLLEPAGGRGRLAAQPPQERRVNFSGQRARRLDRQIGRGGQRVHRPLTVGTGIDMRNEFRRPIGRKCVAEVLVQHRWVRAIGGHEADSSRAWISSLSIFWTLLRALYTTAAGRLRRVVTSVTGSCSSVSRRNASQVCGSTRSRTRDIASASSSRSYAASRRASRSSRAGVWCSAAYASLSPAPCPARCWSRTTSIQVRCATVFSHARNRLVGSYSNSRRWTDSFNRTDCVTSSASASCRPQWQHQVKIRGPYRSTNALQVAWSNSGRRRRASMLAWVCIADCS